MKEQQLAEGIRPYAGRMPSGKECRDTHPVAVSGECPRRRGAFVPRRPWCSAQRILNKYSCQWQEYRKNSHSLRSLHLPPAALPLPPRVSEGYHSQPRPGGHPRRGVPTRIKCQRCLDGVNGACYNYFNSYRQRRRSYELSS